MKNQLNTFLKYLGLLVVIVIAGFVFELLGGDLAEVLKAKLDNYFYPVVIGVGFAAVAFYAWWTDRDKLKEDQRNTSSAAPEAVSESNLEKIRKGQLESFQQRLNSKLAERFPINLELKYSLEGTTTKAPLYDNKTIRSTKIREELIALFDKHRGRLLIIGEPGAGKTTLLLQLAHQLLHRQQETITDIPIIINMATWRSRFNSIEEWMMELLPQIGFSKALAKQFLEDGYLLPLFDGLDELAEDLRDDCLRAIGEYGRRQEARYVICSRIEEYKQTEDAPVYCQIMVKPLTLKQIKEGLQEIQSPETNGLLHAINRDKWLAEAVKTPFYLNMVQLLFAESKAWQEFGFTGDTLEGRQQEIVEEFVTSATSKFPKYSSGQVKKYLAFLADRMTWKGMVEFELVGLQYDWAMLSKKQLIIAGIIEGMVHGFGYGLIFGLVYGIIHSVIFHQTIILVNSLVFSLIFSLIYAQIYGLIGSLVVVWQASKRYWTFILFKKYYKIDLLILLIYSLILSLNCKLFSELISDPWYNPFEHYSSELVFNLLLGLAFGLIGGLHGISFKGQICIKTRDSIRWSFEDYKNGMKQNLVFGIMHGLVITISMGIWSKVSVGHFVLLIGLGIILGIFYGLMIGVIGGFYGKLPEDLLNIKTRIPIRLSFQRYRNTLEWNSILGFAYGLIVSFILGLVYNNLNAMFFGIVYGTIFSLVGGLVGGLVEPLENSISYIKIRHPHQRFRASLRAGHFSLIQYWHLKKLFLEKGLLPKNLVSFFQKVISKNILESDGGTWHFRHSILQEYFVKHWKENYEDEAERKWKAEQDKASLS